MVLIDNMKNFEIFRDHNSNSYMPEVTLIRSWILTCTVVILSMVLIFRTVVEVAETMK